MQISVETLLVISLVLAVFSAVVALGTSLVLGAGFERLRAGFDNLRSGFEIIAKQTGFFSDAIHKLDMKVMGLEEGRMKLMSEEIAEAKAKAKGTKSRKKPKSRKNDQAAQPVAQAALHVIPMRRDESGQEIRIN
ncbi:MAG: hypothetical protein H6862_05280 [Rhodospirillales bacterium]|nr:hypothetical protein [Rhodospirillales bacterium]